jgi:hypothetical protein
MLMANQTDEYKNATANASTNSSVVPNHVAVKPPMTTTMTYCHNHYCRYRLDENEKKDDDDDDYHQYRYLDEARLFQKRANAGDDVTMILLLLCQ